MSTLFSFFRPLQWAGLGLALGLLAGCEKANVALPATERLQSEIDPVPACYTIPGASPTGFGWNFGPSIYPQAACPGYNPLNAQELVYLCDDTLRNGFNTRVCYANLRTGQQRFISVPAASVNLAFNTLSFHEGLTWSRTGWLALCPTQGGIWKVKANGDSLQQLVPGPASCQGTSWSADGQQLAFANSSGIHIVSARTGQLQQLFAPSQVGYATSQLAWSPDGQRLAYVGGQATLGLRVLDLSTGALTELDTLTRRSLPGGVAWRANGQQILWTDRRAGLRQTDVLTRTHRLVYPACASGSSWVSSVALVPGSQQALVGFTDTDISTGNKQFRERLERVDLISGQRLARLRLVADR